MGGGFFVRPQCTCRLERKAFQCVCMFVRLLGGSGLWEGGIDREEAVGRLPGVSAPIYIYTHTYT